MLARPMLEEPEGWYRDPAPRNAGAPDTWRYWDGRCWTARTRTGTRRQRQTWREEVGAARVAHLQDLLDRAEAGDVEALFQLAAAVPDVARPTTRPTARSTARPAARTAARMAARPAAPGGPRLAGWWARVAASLVDGLLVSVLGCLVAWPFLQQVATEHRRFLRDAVQAAGTGTAMPDAAALLEAVAAPLLATSVVLLLLDLAVEVGFLKGYRATPGKLLLGLQVQSGEQSGALPWRAVLLRWTGKSGPGLLRFVPFGVVAYSLYALANSLWPLGDSNRQAFHDKLAGTYVVHRS